MSYWIGRDVLVTGAGGFIGSHLVEKLLDDGANVRALIRYNSRNDPGLLSLLPLERYKEQLQIIPVDLLNLNAVREAMADISHVFHLGAIISVPYSFIHPDEVIHANVIGTLNVLQAARDRGVKRIVHTSSSEVYGSAQSVPIDESHPLQGQSPYAASKIGADKIAESFYCSYDLPVVTLRPFNTYGPRQSARAVIPTIIAQALMKDVIRLGNLETRRDLTYVSDTVAGFLAAGERSGIEGAVINLGTGIDYQIANIVKEIISIVDRPLRIEVDASRLRPNKSEVNRLLSDNNLALQTLGWQPQIDLVGGLTNTVRWMSDNIERYRPDQYQV